MVNTKALLMGLLVLLPGLAACASTASSGCQSGDGGEIQVVRHRWHTGIVIPRQQLAPSLAFLAETFPDADYFEIGWGDDRFYREPDSTWLITRALFWPTGTVLHVVGLEQPPQSLPHRDLLALYLPAPAMQRMQGAIAGDFVYQDQQPVRVAPGLYGESAFYRARGTFWFANTCNTWTARRLADAGVPLRTFMTLTADSIMEQLREAIREDACLAPRKPEDVE